MKRQNVKSSALKSIGYNKKSKTLQTELINDNLYEYYAVPFSEFNNLMTASSIGEYYNKFIKKYKYKKLK